MPLDLRPAADTAPDVIPDLSGKSVAIVAMGPSHWEYAGHASFKGHRHEVADEIWAINSMAGFIQCDRVFFMDSPPRALAEQGRHWRWLEEPGPPIYTCIAYSEFPRTLAYPLEAVLNRVKHPYFNTSVAYAMGYALAGKAAEISLFGTDFAKEGDATQQAENEKGRGCVEFWIGVALERRVRIRLGLTTQLMDMCVDPLLKFYGYSEHGLNAGVNLENGRYVVRTRPLGE